MVLVNCLFIIIQDCECPPLAEAGAPEGCWRSCPFSSCHLFFNFYTSHVAFSPPGLQSMSTWFSVYARLAFSLWPPSFSLCPPGLQSTYGQPGLQFITTRHTVYPSWPLLYDQQAILHLAFSVYGLRVYITITIRIAFSWWSLDHRLLATWPPDFLRVKPQPPVIDHYNNGWLDIISLRPCQVFLFHAQLRDTSITVTILQCRNRVWSLDKEVCDDTYILVVCVACNQCTALTRLHVSSGFMPGCHANIELSGHLVSSLSPLSPSHPSHPLTPLTPPLVGIPTVLHLWRIYHNSYMFFF